MDDLLPELNFVTIRGACGSQISLFKRQLRLSPQAASQKMPSGGEFWKLRDQRTGDLDCPIKRLLRLVMPAHPVVKIGKIDFAEQDAFPRSRRGAAFAFCQIAKALSGRLEIADRIGGGSDFFGDRGDPEFGPGVFVFQRLFARVHRDQALVELSGRIQKVASQGFQPMGRKPPVLADLSEITIDGVLCHLEILLGLVPLAFGLPASRGFPVVGCLEPAIGRILHEREDAQRQDQDGGGRTSG